MKNLNFNPIKLRQKQDPGLARSLSVVTNRLLRKYPTALRYKVTVITVLCAEFIAISVWEACSKQIGWVQLCCSVCKSPKTLAVQRLSSVKVPDLLGVCANAPSGVRGRDVMKIQALYKLIGVIVRDFFECFKLNCLDFILACFSPFLCCSSSLQLNKSSS